MRRACLVLADHPSVLAAGPGCPRHRQGATIVSHFLLVRRRPADQGWQRDGAGRVVTVPAPCPRTAPEKRPPRPAAMQILHGLRYRPVAYVTAAAVLGSAAIAAVAIYLLSYLRQDGYSLTVPAIATGALGVLQVAGRVVRTVTAASGSCTSPALTCWRSTLRAPCLPASVGCRPFWSSLARPPRPRPPRYCIPSAAATRRCSSPSAPAPLPLPCCSPQRIERTGRAWACPV